MRGEKPENIEEYRKWLKEERGVEITARIATYYEAQATKIRTDLEQSDFWLELQANLREFNDEYKLQKGYDLLLGFSPTLREKSFGSFFLKTFRKNVLQNDRWPSEPDGGWILPSNWLSRIEDIVRTLLVVKYLDGVEFLAGKVGSVCDDHQMQWQFSLEARTEGYYAAHLYTTRDFEVPKEPWDTERVRVAIELQITTQLQENIRSLLHKYYEERRGLTAREEDRSWQWNYASDEFAANYLGHILHYVEGMIMGIRERQTEHGKVSSRPPRQLAGHELPAHQVGELP